MKIHDLIQKIALSSGEDNPFPDDLDAFLADFIPNDLLKSDTLQMAFGVSNYEMELLYRDGYSYYQAGYYAEAAITFRYLVLFNPFIKKHWMGLGGCQQMRQEWQKSLKSYAVASLLDNDDPFPHYYAYQIFQEIGNRTEEALALDCAYARACARPVYESLRQKLEPLMLSASSSS